MGEEIIKALISGGYSAVSLCIIIVIGYYFQKKLDTRNDNIISNYKHELDIIKNQQLTLLNFNSVVASNLWTKRYESYAVFWKLSEILPQYPQKVNISYSDLYTASKAMRDWYFENGGMLLSEETKKAYFNLQEEILKIADKDNIEPLSSIAENGKIDEYEKIRKLFSAVRSSMTEDLDSRKITL